MAAIKTAIRILISVGLLIYLIYLAEPAKILGVLSSIWREGRSIYIAVAVVIFLFSQLVQTIRWQILVSGYGLKIPTSVLFQYYMIGLFFNNFLPTGIGGDVIRIYKLVQRSGDRTVGFASVITERLIGITATLIISIIALLFMSEHFSNRIPLYLAIGFLAGIFLFFFIIFQDRFFHKFSQLVQNIKLFRLGERILKFIEALRYYKNSKLIYIKILALSLAAQSLIIFMTYYMAMALGIVVTLNYLFFVVPVTFLLTMLPSINGMGVREGGFVLLLGKIGVSKAAAVSLSFLSILIPMAVSVIGGILFIIQKKMPTKEDLKHVDKII